MPPELVTITASFADPTYPASPAYPRPRSIRFTPTSGATSVTVPLAPDGTLHFQLSPGTYTVHESFAPHRTYTLALPPAPDGPSHVDLSDLVLADPLLAPTLPATYTPLP